jgi:hypothetical protein
MTGTSFAVAAPFWALMALLPRWSWIARIVGAPLIGLPVPVSYGLLVVPALGESAAGHRRLG